jgi:hypothetical protein
MVVVAFLGLKGKQKKIDAGNAEKKKPLGKRIWRNRKIMKLVEQNIEFLLDWRYDNFFEPKSAAFDNLDWICKGCRETVKQWERQKHFQAHKDNKVMIVEANRLAAKLAIEQDTGDGLRHDVCVQCGSAFTQTRKRGRPRKKCLQCLPEKE